jgi:hypothetical protein
MVAMPKTVENIREDGAVEPLCVRAVDGQDVRHDFLAFAYDSSLSRISVYLR